MAEVGWIAFDSSFHMLFRFSSYRECRQYNTEKENPKNTTSVNKTKDFTVDYPRLTGRRPHAGVMTTLSNPQVTPTKFVATNDARSVALLPVAVKLPVSDFQAMGGPMPSANVLPSILTSFTKTVR